MIVAIVWKIYQRTCLTKNPPQHLSVPLLVIFLFLFYSSPITRSNLRMTDENKHTSLLWMLAHQSSVKNLSIQDKGRTRFQKLCMIYPGAVKRLCQGPVLLRNGSGLAQMLHVTLLCFNKLWNICKFLFLFFFHNSSQCIYHRKTIIINITIISIAK